MSLSKLWPLLPLTAGLFLATSIPLKNGLSNPLSSLIALSLLYSSLDWSSKGGKNILLKELIAIALFSCGFYLIAYYWLPQTLSGFHGVSIHSHMRGIQYSLIALPAFWFFVLIKPLVLKLLNKPFFWSAPSFLIIVFSLVLSLLEHYVPHFLPVSIGHAWLPLAPYLGLAPVFGVPGFTFFTSVCAFCIIFYFKERTANLGLLFGVMLFILLNIIMKLGHDSDADPSSSIRVLMVQPNISSRDKIQAEEGDVLTISQMAIRLSELSTKRGGDPDLIIWPETAWPEILESSKMKEDKVHTPIIIESVTKAMNTYLLWGGYDKSSHDYEDRYNSVFFSSPDNELLDHYHKHLLVPFGEGLPFGPLTPYLKKYYPQVSFYSRGERFPHFSLSNNDVSFISIICYEVLFSRFVKRYLNSLVERPSFIVNISNDSWYGDTSSPRQHHYLARWRALEFGLPIIRLSNSGLSSLILPDGSQSEVMDFSTSGTLTVLVSTKRSSKTFYESFGGLSLLPLSLLFSFFVALYDFRALGAQFGVTIYR